MLRAFLFRLERIARPPHFAVTIDGNGARADRGSPPAAWIADCDDIAREFGLERGTIDAVRSGRRLELRFSPDVPRSLHQRFRNVFGTHSASR